MIFCKRYLERVSFHHLKFLVRARVESTRGVSFLDPVLNLLSVFVGCREWNISVKAGEG